MYCASTVLLKQGLMAPIVLLVASCNVIIKFFRLYCWINMYVLLSLAVLLDNYSQLILVVLIVLIRQVVEAASQLKMGKGGMNGPIT